jgi:hypothetical protein
MRESRQQRSSKPPPQRVLSISGSLAKPSNSCSWPLTLYRSITAALGLCAILMYTLGWFTRGKFVATRSATDDFTSFTSPALTVILPIRQTALLLVHCRRRKRTRGRRRITHEWRKNSSTFSNPFASADATDDICE